MTKKTFKSISGKKYDNIMGRCYRKKDTSYKNYGAKGIKVAGKWLEDINAFRSWLLKQLEASGISQEEFVNNSKNYVIDRIKSDGHYTPKNCRITSPQQNARNKKGVLKYVVSAEGKRIKLS